MRPGQKRSSSASPTSPLDARRQLRRSDEAVNSPLRSSKLRSTNSSSTATSPHQNSASTRAKRPSSRDAGATNGVDSPLLSSSNGPRRSERQRKLHYPCFDPDYMANIEVMRLRCQEQEQQLFSGRQKRRPPDENNGVADDEDSAPFSPAEESTEEEESLGTLFNHVTFSPSSKQPPNSSPRINTRSRFRSSRLRRVRLHNLPSEDEQSEFNRRYSRDLRSRRRMQQHEEVENEEVAAVATSSLNISNRRMTRNSSFANIDDLGRGGDSQLKEENEEEEEKNPSKKSPIVEQCKPDDEAVTEGLRRSARTHKATLGAERAEVDRIKHRTESSSSSSNEEQQQQHERPKRSRLPVKRLNYEPSNVTSRMPRRCSGELRNLDQYSTDEEYAAADDIKSRRKRYNMRERKRIARYEEREYSDRFAPNSTSQRRPFSKDLTRRETRRKKMKSYKDSSSPSSNDTDEEHFQRRKTKRMNIERSKLLPVNLNKTDVAKAIFRDRQKIGASLADVSPMELDLAVKFDSVGGCASHINNLKEMVVFPLLYPEIFNKFSITAPRGVLFHGPPGTGKTLMARALASESSRDGKKVAFFMRKGADCLSKWIGESERQLRLLFDQAFLMRPSIIFFDEIDGLAPVRSSRQDQIHSSIVSTLLALMDGLDNRGEIIVIGATNRIENIDPALRRPGRFDRELRFDLPTREARKEILQLHTKTWVPALSSELVEKLADKCIGYCGADIKGLCSEAALSALKRRYPQVYSSNQKLAINVEKVQVKEEDFYTAMANIVPSAHRIEGQWMAPLPLRVQPLLQRSLHKIIQDIDRVMSCLMRAKSSFSATSMNDSASCHFRPRVLVRSEAGMGLTTYLAPAVIHHLEKIPCHKLDIPALYSNAARSPEEAICQIIHETKRTAPSCLYIPRIPRVWKVMTCSARETFLSLLGDILPTAPVFILATQEERSTDDDDEEATTIPSGLFCHNSGEVVMIEKPNAEERRNFFAQILAAACAPIEEDEEEATEQLEVIPVADLRELSERESKRLKKREQQLQTELRIFLRDVWAKINREQKFFMFRTPVDTNEVYDYLDVVKEPMDFDTMLTKLDNREYKCARDFLGDIDLIAENAITYNGDPNYETNKIICHRARALQDFCYALVKAEMDTDFEEECIEIKKRVEKLEEQQQSGQTKDEPEKSVNTTSCSNEERRRKPARKRTWARGVDMKKKKRRRSRVEAKKEDEPAAAVSESENKDVVVNDETGEVTEDAEEIANGGSPASLSTTSEMVPTGIRIDQSKLNSLLSDLVQLTEGLSIEMMERTYTDLMRIISSYSAKSDRTTLPSDMQQGVIERLKRQNDRRRN